MKQEILLEQKIGLRLSRVGMLSKVFAIQSFVKHEHGLTPEQFTVLFALKENDGMYLRQLANITFKDRPNMTRIVSILEINGYVTSVVESEGRQVKKIYITEKGIKVCDTILPTVLDIWDSMCENLSEAEVEAFLKTLRKLETNLRDKVVLQN